MAKILVVDDSMYARRRLRQTLETHGHTVIEAGSGMAALESYVVSPPDLVLLDLTMEDLGGLEVLHRLREIDPAAAVVVVSADVQRSTAKLVAEAGAFRFLAKPADPGELIDAVQAALREVAS
jgi:DNA-binding response OmpR family regulator